MTKILKRIPYTKADFNWVHWGPKEIKKKSDTLIAEVKKIQQEIKNIPDGEWTFENTIFPLDIIAGISHNAQGVISVIKSISTDKKLRDFASKEGTKLAERMIELLHDREIYNALKKYEKLNEKLGAEEKKLVKDILLGYRRMGFELNKKEHDLFKKNLKEISKLSNMFSKNINDYKDNIAVTKEELSGLTERYISSLKKDKKGKYLVSLSYPELFPFLEYADNEEKRKELTIKSSMRGGKKNLVLLKRIIELKTNNAKLLKYPNYADYAMEVRMAKNLKTAMSFVMEIMKDLSKQITKEKNDLVVYKRKITGDKNAKLYNYDGAYYVTKMIKELFTIDGEALRPYFPFERVKDKTLGIYSKLLSVNFSKIDFPVWHQDVEWYEIRDKKKGLLGYFFMDLYPREGKYNHACAMDVVKPRILSPNGNIYQTPVSAMIANFAKPTKDNPSLLSHDEVETFFHEFGHLMHSLVTTAKYANQSGFSVAWDFVEIPSQLFENWIWDENILKDMSSHYKTGEKLSKDIIKNLIATRNFRKATWTNSQLTAALFDLHIHSKKINEPLNEYSKKIFKKYTLSERPKESLHPAGFGHLVDGYDAGYYSYLWSLVYAHDVFTRFKKEGVMDSKTGMDLRTKILAKGGSEDEMKMLTDFLGRKPNNKAFLKELGIK